jgi:uncharacterized protein (TIGR03067 family)
MKKLLLAAIFCVFVLSAALLGGDTKKAKLDGAWEQQSRKVDGKDDNDKKRVVTIKEGKFTTEVDGKKTSGTVELHTSTTPKSYTVKVKDKTYHGIYKLEGDKLTTCASSKEGDKAPKEFKAEKGTELTVWKRKK